MVAETLLLGFLGLVSLSDGAGVSTAARTTLLTEIVLQVSRGTSIPVAVLRFVVDCLGIALVVLNLLVWPEKT